ncbi:HNH endonuclease [Marivivens donghaensis]|uniref:HNH endonuclease n=1 Tax=Marivivens donghaensis TaxID=1699413 RepID=UPI00201FA66C|nr:hypothetical protein [Marivivens donghaensis]MCL7409446.1 hypothetical protein [Marivivens donghaensis]MDN3702925.1 hypothetical protein [Marivivens donghaensis]
MSGFKSHSEATGGSLRRLPSKVYRASPQSPLNIDFILPEIASGHFSGFGFYYRSDVTVSLQSNREWFSSRFHTNYEDPLSVNKCGFIWQAEEPNDFRITLTPSRATDIEIFNAECGEVWHDFFEGARDNVLKNIHTFAPEANFYTRFGEVVIGATAHEKPFSVVVKECNRCARFLPINLPAERHTLSFSNHCVAKRPCRHKGFGIVNDLDKGVFVELEYGFQLECRFCKKFVVNAALNPQRSADQMKEDSQRRRYFELMIAEMSGVSEQLAFRHKTGVELASFIWEKFGKKCFKCGDRLRTAREMHLDHTRPLALLWPLDETATALCGSCNSTKRDRQPKDFYSQTELVELSKFTGIPLPELLKPLPNINVLKALIERCDWLVDDFLNQDFLKKEKDGKTSAELICKSLDRVLKISELDFGDFSFSKKWNDHFLA